MPGKRKPSRSRLFGAFGGRWSRIAVSIAAICGFVALASAPAGAVHDLHFQLDGNTSATSYPGGSTANQPYDWESFFNGSGAGGTGAPVPGSLTGGFVTTGFKADFALPDSSTYATGSKDTLPVSGWQCGQSNNVGDKVDIVNAYSAAFRDPTSGHLILYFGMEKSSPNGDSNIGMWFLKDGTVDCNATSGGSKTFTGAHQDGDL